MTDVFQNSNPSPEPKDAAAREFEIFKTKLACQVEGHKALLQRTTDAAKANLELRAAFVQATLKFGNDAVRGLMLVNGGAILAILTFIGNLATKLSHLNGGIKTISWSLGFFCLGILGAIGSNCIAYFSQHRFTDAMFKGEAMGLDKAARGERLKTASVASAAVSATAFVAGVISALSAVQSMLRS